MKEPHCIICGKIVKTFSGGARSIDLIKQGIDLPKGMKGTEWLCYEDYQILTQTKSKADYQNVFFGMDREPIESNYDILDIPDDSNESEIKEAFRKLSLKYHSDRGGNDHQFIKIKQAYEKLKEGKKYPENTVLPNSNTNYFENSHGKGTKIIGFLITMGIVVLMGLITGFFMGLK